MEETNAQDTNTSEQASTEEVKVEAKPLEQPAKTAAESKAEQKPRQRKAKPVADKSEQESATNEHVAAPSEQADVHAQAKQQETANTERHEQNDVTEVVSAELSESQNDDENKEGRTRSRRSPRHLRAAGQRRRRQDTPEKGQAAAFVPVADQAAAEYEAELKAKSSSDIDVQEGVQQEANTVETQLSPEAVTEDNAPAAEVTVSETHTDAEQHVETKPAEAQVDENAAQEAEPVKEVEASTAEAPLQQAAQPETSASADEVVAEAVEAMPQEAAKEVKAEPIADTVEAEQVESTEEKVEAETAVVEEAQASDTEATPEVQEPAAEAPATEAVEETTAAETVTESSTEDTPVAETVEAPTQQVVNSNSVQSRIRFNQTAAAPMTKAQSVIEDVVVETPSAMPHEQRQTVANSGSGVGSKSPTGRASADMASPAQVD